MKDVARDMASNRVPDFCPYKGLQPYTEADRAYFFGRRRDQEIIASNLYAASLTVLHGASGVGKSSVLMAGVVPKLKKSPRLAIMVFRDWQDTSFKSAIKDEVLRTVSRSTGKEIGDTDGLAFDEFLLRCTLALGGPIFFIFDQFEEYFLYHPPSHKQDSFDAELARAVNRREINVNFLLSMRDDSLSKLDRFQGRIPNLLGNMLRLEHLDRAAATDAIRKPLDEYNRWLPDGLTPMSIEDALVDDLLEELRTGKVTLDQTGQGQVSAKARDTLPDTRIETPYLQLVMMRLWDEELKAGSHTLRLSTLKQLGNAEFIVRTHLDKVMEKLSEDGRDIAAHLFRFLVTPTGMKIAHTLQDLASYAELPPERIEPVLNLLISPDVRILCPVAPPPGQPAKLRYEIFHDVLAPAILDWWARYVQAQKRAEAEKALAQERAEAERQAAEQQRQLEQAKALAEAERERAEERQRRILEQARSARRLRWLAAALALTALFAIGAATFAGLQLRKVNAAKNREKVSRDAAALSLNGDIEGALNKYNEAVKLYRDVGDHEGEVATLTAIARVYRSVDNQAETENYFKQAIEVGEQRLGPGSLTLANILAELALFYRGQKKFEQAEQLYGRALEVRVRAAGGRENEFVATSLQSLGTIYREWGRYYESKSIPEEAKRLYAKAEPFYEEALAIRRKVLPPSHPDVATSAYGLAQLYYLEGKYEQARPLYEEAVAIRRKILPNHPFLATTLLDYAKLLEKLQRHAEAASMMEESRRINENQ